MSSASESTGVRTPDTGFDHRDPGTAEEEWVRSGLLELAAPLDIGGLRRLIVVAAHPDDETLGAGGLIAEADGLGVAVTVVVATAGEGSHPAVGNHTPGGVGGSADGRRCRRRSGNWPQPLCCASWISRTALSPHGWAGLPPRSMQWYVLTATVMSVVAAQARGSSRRGSRIGTPITRPRRRLRRAVARANNCRLLQYPIWAWHWAHPGDGTLRPEMLTGLALTDAPQAAKRRALAAHRSQTEPLSDEPGDEAVVPPGFRDHFNRSRELFVELPDIDSPAGSLGREYFDGFYTSGADPWGFETRWYEKRKRAITLASLPRERFRSAFEPGCAIGVLSLELAERCDRLLASDISAAPLALAGQRSAGRQGVTFRQLRVPQEWPTGPFDLIVLSEIGYYCDAADLSLLIEAATTSLSTDGVMVACHWRHPVADYPLSGDEVHELLRRQSGLDLLVEHVEEDFRLDVLVTPPAVSVARREGLVS